MKILKLHKEQYEDKTGKIYIIETDDKKQLKDFNDRKEKSKKK